MFTYFFVSILIIVFLFVGGFFLHFYRKPKQIVSINTDVVKSPAYGKIMKIIRNNNKIFIAIHLTLFDVHYQFSPVSGKITDMTYDATGKFHLSYDLNKSKNNEKTILTFKNKNGIFRVFQIAGNLVRRISVYKRIGDILSSGETIGIIYFGSRVDLIIENTEDFDLQVKEGQYLKGSYSTIGVYKKNWQ